MEKQVFLYKIEELKTVASKMLLTHSVIEGEVGDVPDLVIVLVLNVNLLKIK